MTDYDLINMICKNIGDTKKTVVSFTTTSRKSPPIKMLPERQAFGFRIINVLITENELAKYCFNKIDGLVDVVMIDVERKQKIDLWDIALKCIKKSKLVPIKPNDATVEAALFLLKHLWNNCLAKKVIAIYGAGNIGAKLALRLAEMNNKIYLYSRNKEKTKQIAAAFNSVLPRFSSGIITPVDNIVDAEQVDALISFVSATGVITEDLLSILPKGAAVIDGGIDNFSEGFICSALEKKIHIYRLDVRPGFFYTALDLLPDVGQFFKEVQGEKIIDRVRVVAGGVVGQRGDIVLDNIKTPTMVLGVANGIGGLLNETPVEFRDRVSKIKKAIEGSSKEM